MPPTSDGDCTARVAGSFFVIPSIFVLLLLSWLAAAHSDIAAVRGLLYGVQPVVIAVVVSAVLRIGGRTLNHAVLVAFAAAAFVGIYFLSIPFPVVVAVAALGGLVLQRSLPEVFAARGHGDGENTGVIEEGHAGGQPSAMRNLKLLGIFVLLWAVPVGVLFLWRGGGDVLVHEALFFTGAAFVTFGGAYAVLSYIAHAAVAGYGWLSAGQMVQGLALAESTPGPLIMVTQYVGFLGAWNNPGGFDPLFNGILGALVTTFVTFLPCFLFIFLLAPYVQILSENRWVQAALVGVTAAVVGVIANLAVFFAVRVLFPEGISVGGLDVFALALAAVSFVLIQKLKVPIHFAVPLGAVAGMIWTLL